MKISKAVKILTTMLVALALLAAFFMFLTFGMALRGMH